MITRLNELIAYRELIVNLVMRDLKVRYKNSVLGFVWSLLNPLFMMMVFIAVFSIMLPNRSVANFPVFILCALLPWNFFATSVIGSINSIVGNGYLITQVYFPREVLPLSTVLSNMVNFLLALIVLFAVIFLSQVKLTLWALLLPLIILTQVIFTSGVAFILSTLNVYYRDTQVIMEVVMLAWFFLTPVFYPIDILPQSQLLLGFAIDIRRLAYILNPMASLIASYRVILYDGAPPAFDFLFRTFVTAVAVALLGYGVFLRYSRFFAEEL